MKSCFIVNYWADTDEKVQIVVDCIRQLKKTGKDIIYTSLCPVDKRISDETVYSIYHNKNELISLADLLDTDIILTNNVSYDSISFRFFSIPLNWKDVAYAMSTQLFTNFKILKSLEYTHCHFINGDCFITDNELSVFSTIENACALLNKKAYFDDISEKFGKAYSTIYFYSDVDFFLSTFILNKSKEDHIKQYSSDTDILCFEQVLYYNFKNKEKHLLLGNNDSFDLGHLSIFKESKIDIITSFNASTNYHIIPLELVQGVIDFSYIFVVSQEPNVTNFKIYVDDEVEECNLVTNDFCYFKTSKKQFHLKILKNNIVDFEETVTEHRLKRIHSYSFFDAYKRNI